MVLILTLLSVFAREEIYLCSTWIFGKMLKISSILTFLSLCAGEEIYLDFWKNAKIILKTDTSFSVCRSRNLPVLYLNFWNTAKNTILYIFLYVQEKEYLPVRALYFGDTGTPLDRKEARFNLGPLECHGDTLFTHSVTFRRQVCDGFRGPDPDCKNLSGSGFIRYLTWA